jgi:glycolate oxidase FAD binding subunit
MPPELAGLQARVSALVGPDQVLVGPAAAAFAVDGVAPRLVARPGTQDEVAAVVAAAGGAGAALAPWGSGAGMGLGNPPARLDLVISLERLTRLVEFDAANLVVTAEAGVRLGDLRAKLEREREFLALDPAGLDGRTVGGALAANASGPSRLLYGTPRDLVLGLRVVTAAGERIRCGGKVIKNVSGYDMVKLFIGSLGTLGIITEATFRLLPAPATRAIVAGTFRGLAPAEAVVTRVLQSFLLPEALELLDARALAPVASALGLPGASGYGLVASVAGSRETVERQVRDLGRLFADGAAVQASTLDGPGAASAGAAVRDAPGPAVTGTGAVAVKIAVPISLGPALFAAAEELALHHAWQAGVAAHAGSGIVRAAYATGDTPAAAVRDGLEALRAQAEAAGGSLVLDAAPPALKAVLDAWGKPGGGFSVMRRMKAEFDPRGAMSPGRFLGGI